MKSECPKVLPFKFWWHHHISWAHLLRYSGGHNELMGGAFKRILPWGTHEGGGVFPGISKFPCSVAPILGKGVSVVPKEVFTGQGAITFGLDPPTACISSALLRTELAGLCPRPEGSAYLPFWRAAMGWFCTPIKFYISGRYLRSPTIFCLSCNSLHFFYLCSVWYVRIV